VGEVCENVDVSYWWYEPLEEGMVVEEICWCWKDEAEREERVCVSEEVVVGEVCCDLDEEDWAVVAEEVRESC